MAGPGIPRASLLSYPDPSARASTYLVTLGDPAHGHVGTAAGAKDFSRPWPRGGAG